MSDLSEFLLARIADDELVAKRVREDDATVTRMVFGVPFFKRLEAECEAKRRIVQHRALFDEAARVRAISDPDGAQQARDTRLGLDIAVQLLALPYADHSDYRDEWRP